MAEPLYNMYRPKIFDEIVGQKKVVEALKKRSKENNFPRTILLKGSTGTGKSTMEKIISKSILCGNKDELGNPCNTCSTCQDIILERINAKYFLKNASNLGIDEMRELEQTANLRELGIKNKVIVIDEFQEIVSNQKASKNILKILEKQSKYTYFILCTMDDSKINKAIKDRCVSYKLDKLSYEDIGEALCNICTKEKIEIDAEKSEVLLTIAESVEGSMRGAISYLERCIDSNIWTVDETIKELDIVSNQALSESINYLLSGDIKVLDLKFTDDILKRTRYLFNLLFKSISNYNLNSYEKSQLQNIDKNVTTKESLMIAYEELNNLFTYSYQPQDLIEYHLIKIVQRIKELTKSNSKVKLEEDKKYNGLYCSICGEKQYDISSGSCCKNSHGGVDGISLEEWKDKNKKEPVVKRRR